MEFTTTKNIVSGRNEIIYRLSISNVPIPKARAGWSNKISYDPQDVLKKSLREQAFYTIKKTSPSFKPLKGPIYINMIFLMPIPVSWAKYKIKAIKEDNIYVWHFIKPDISNLTKFCEDAFNGILWKDDSQIAKDSHEKIYSINPRTVIEFKELYIPNWKRIKK